MILLLLRKKIYLLFLLSILLFVTLDNLSYNYVAFGKEYNKDDNGGEKEGGSEEREDKEESKDDNGGEKEGESEEREDKEESKDDNGGEKEGESEEDFEDMSLNELFDDNDNDGDDNTREEKEEKEEKENKDNVPFILPFKAVPFP